ncbi:hypothetical protein DY000_02034972 [Brassica cretica]|uniref:Uncharacterized protein n=1 Tax=Brassica cretica TaxID=69181 RepID=A0ABQ7DHX0_BRACR|nr:hypothetical protein DY000_02034972 [Brassica cretica]
MKIIPPESQDIDISHSSFVVSKALQENRSKSFRNRFLDLARNSSVLKEIICNGCAACTVVLSRVGYFIPLPGFDRKTPQDNYLSFFLWFCWNCVSLEQRSQAFALPAWAQSTK